jgi:hypothetical protein
MNLTNEELTKLYNEANEIPDGKFVPISTDRIFKAMRAAYQLGAQVDTRCTKASYCADRRCVTGESS